MPLTTDIPPTGVARAAQRAVHTARRVGQGQTLRLPIKLTPGVQVFTTPGSRLGGRLLSAAEPRGWLYLAIDAEGTPCTINISVINGVPLITHRSFGTAPTRLRDALLRLDEHTKVPTRVRLLRIPGLFFSALWLQTAKRNRLVVLRAHGLAKDRTSLRGVGKALATLAQQRRSVDADV